MAEQNVEIVRAAYDAFARGDIPSVLAAFDPGVEFIPSDAFPHGGLCRGHEEMVAYFQTFATTYEQLEVQPDEFLDAGDHVVALGHERGRANGMSFVTPFAHVWTLRDGKAVHWKEYLDPAQELRAHGWQAPASVAVS